MHPIHERILVSVGLALVMAFGWAVAIASPSHADTATDGVDREEILAVYGSFKDAQNERDADAVGRFFVDGPQFLWVSDGRSFWGREAVLQRMSSFQRAEQWLVLPELESAEIIALGDDTAILHMPLVLQIDLFAMPARREGDSVEGFGLVYLEAGWFGSPSLAGRDGGAAEAVQDGETGLLCDGAEGRDVTQALARLIDDPVLRASLGAAAAEHARRQVWARRVGEYLAT